MSDLIENPALGSGIVYTCAALSVAVIILAIIILINVRNVSRLTKRYNSLMRNSDRNGATLESLLGDCFDEMCDLRGASQALKLRLSAVEKQLAGCFQKIGVVRYNPFNDTGGDLSYVIALLDETNTGFIINGIYSRAGSYTYAKEIENGVSERYKLSPEELEALQIAVSNSVDRRIGRE